MITIIIVMPYACFTQNPKTQGDVQNTREIMFILLLVINDYQYFRLNNDNNNIGTMILYYFYVILKQHTWGF